MARTRAAYHVARWRASERRAARRSDLLICVSSYDRTHFQNYGASCAVVIPNGVDDSLFELSEEPVETPRVLFFGTFGWKPNAVEILRYLHEVWPRVVRELPSAELRIAGSGPLESIRAAASETPRATVLGFVPDLRTELRSARVVVAPIWSGGGTRIKVLEALAAARPVVGTTVGVERIGFEHDRHGLIGDGVDALTQATLHVLLNDEVARRYARNARTLAERYRWATVTKPLEEIYGQFIERRRTVFALG